MKITTGMILAAGFGTRLRPLTDELPKPLVPVGDRSVLAHAADNLRAMGVDRVVINTHHLADHYDAAALEACLGLSVSLRHETAILGTAGGVAGARALLGDGPIVIHNGDILADLDVTALLDTHQRSRALATLAVRAGLAAGRGPVGLDAEGRIVRLRDQSFGVEREGAEFIGVHVVSEALQRRLPAEGCMVGDVYIPALAAGENIAAARAVRAYTDVGTLATYLAANHDWLARTGRAAYRGPDTSVAPEVDLDASIVGAGATVTGRGILRRCVVWPGASARAPLADAVVTAGGRVVQEIAPIDG